MTLCINPRCDQPQNSDNVQFCQNCQSPLLLKQRYRATKVLGSGGFGKTYEASDLGTPDKVIKVLITNSPKAVELFQREAEVLSQLNNPGIPRVEPNSYIVFHPADGQEPVHCLVMEKIHGDNLRDYLRKLRQSIDSDTATRWLKELVLILQEVHEQGILHRDIKPQNIIFKPVGRLALIDFGAVREGTGTEVATGASSSGGTEVASHMTGGTSVVSRGYTAPEQMNGEALRQSDFYSLSRTFIFLLTGKEPSEISYDAYNDVLQWRKYAPTVDSELAELLDQMQSTQVKQRPKNADEILQRLQGKSHHPGHSKSPVQGEDIELNLTITSQEAAAGVTKDIIFERIVYEGGSVNSKRRENKTLTVKVPPSSANGKRLRLVEQGNDGLNGGTPGNVYVCLNVESYSPQPDPSGVVYAGFLRRSLAFAVDILLVVIVCGVLITLFPSVYSLSSILFAISAFAQAEASKDKATAGKGLMNIVVTNEQGQKISYGKSIARNLIKYASIACFGMGILYFIFSALFSRKKQALHDLLTGCIVVRL